VLKIAAHIEKMRLHFCHLSTQSGVEAINEAKKNGKIVSCEVTPHNLLLSKEDYEYLGVKALTMPPLRTKDNVNALWSGIVDNIVDCIGSDHAPHTIDEKEIDDVWSAKPGIPGLETTLPLILTQVHRRLLSLPQAVRILSEYPAQIFGLKDRGILEQGKNADLVIVNFKEKYKIDASKFQSKAKFSPFNGWEVQGKPLRTFVNGQVAKEDNQVTGREGKIIIARGGQ
jgi:dihydroorotase